MDLSELEQLVQIVQNASISDLTLRQGQARITIRKATGMPVLSSNMALVPTHEVSGFDSEYQEAEWTDEMESEAGEEPEQALWITATLVGVFHHVKPLVGLGAKVTQGQVVGVIEAMRLITEVTAPRAGVVVDTVIEDGLPVEYGQHLFLLEPDAEVPAS